MRSISICFRGRLTGSRYYEGKEFETQLKHKRPGDLSPELVEALSIPPLAPPPWLISMQRFGPPPSYPTLRIPGLNAPIPEGYSFIHYHLSHCLTLSIRAQWGFHPGGWGKPPLDEYNRPLYGDVFGVLPKNTDADVSRSCSIFFPSFSLDNISPDGRAR